MALETGAGGSSFGPESMEPELAGAVARSSTSILPLLEPAPSSLCAASAAAAVGDAGGRPLTRDLAAIVALQHEEEVMMTSHQMDKVVVMVPAASRPEAPPSPAEVMEGGGGWKKGKAPSGGSVGRFFVTKNSCVEVSLPKEADVSSEEEDKKLVKEKKKKEKEKEKKKKSSSWRPDPEKRWPIQGFY